MRWCWYVPFVLIFSVLSPFSFSLSSFSPDITLIWWCFLENRPGLCQSAATKADSTLKQYILCDTIENILGSVLHFTITSAPTTSTPTNTAPQPGIFTVESKYKGMYLNSAVVVAIHTYLFIYRRGLQNTWYLLSYCCSRSICISISRNMHKLKSRIWCWMHSMQYRCIAHHIRLVHNSGSPCVL